MILPGYGLEAHLDAWTADESRQFWRDAVPWVRQAAALCHAPRRQQRRTGIWGDEPLCRQVPGLCWMAPPGKHNSPQFVLGQQFRQSEVFGFGQVCGQSEVFASQW